ncbi:MAG TPA: hypothetical protein VF824_11870 [Thermoanaerobaculia bacterium]|jgi:hypothetical protein
MKQRAPRKAKRAALSERAYVTIVFVLYALITLWVTLHHEPWRDEADSWLLLRNGGVGTMLARTGYVGMPALFYLLVAPLVKLGLPYLTQNLLNLVLAWGAALVFLLYAPLSRAMRVLFLFSFYMSFEYAVVARPYALSLLLLFAAIAAWPARRERPLLLALFVALLANVTPHALFMAAVLGAIFLGEVLLEKRWRDLRGWLAASVMVIGGALSAWQLRPPPELGGKHIIRAVNLVGIPWSVGNAFLPNVPFAAGSLFGFALLLAVTVALGRRVVPQLFLWSSLLFLFFIYGFVWVAGLRHAGMIMIVAVVALWLASHDDAPPSRARPIAEAMLAVALVVSIGVALQYWWRDTFEPFSASRQTAEFIKRNHLDRYEIAAHEHTAAEAVLPYLDGKRFYYPGMHDYGTYMLWDARYDKAVRTLHAEALRDALQRFQGTAWLLLVNARMDGAERFGFRQIFQSDAPFDKADERYWIYAPLDWPAEPLGEPR